jgi:hypothetical protein
MIAKKIVQNCNNNNLEAALSLLIGGFGIPFLYNMVIDVSVFSLANASANLLLVVHIFVRVWGLSAVIFRLTLCLKLTF